MHHELDSNGNFEERSLWVHKVSVENSGRARGSQAWDLVHLMNCSFTCLTSVFSLDIMMFLCVVSSDVPLLSNGHGCVDVPTSSDLASACYAVAGFRSPLHNWRTRQVVQPLHPTGPEHPWHAPEHKESTHISGWTATVRDRWHKNLSFSLWVLDRLVGENATCFLVAYY